MRAKGMAALGAALILCGCVTAGPTPTASVAPVSEPGGPSVAMAPYKLSAAEISAIKDGVKRGLKDPGSAQFEGGFAAGQEPGKKEITVCGFVNAKNGFGGYTGRKPFMGVLQAKPAFFATAGYGGTSSETEAVLTICKRYGLSPI